MGDLVFGSDEARQYEAWFGTAEGQRADRLEKALFAGLLAPFGPPGTLLEVGCGTGHFMRWFEQEGWSATGVDVSAPMLHEARRRDPSVWIAVAQGERLPFPDRAFDTVALVTVLEFVSDPGAAVREGLRVCRRGLLLGVLNAWSPLAVRRRIEAAIKPSPYGVARFMSPAQVRRLVCEAAPDTRVEVSQSTTLWPGWLPVEQSSLPFGAFLGVAVKVQE